MKVDWVVILVLIPFTLFGVLLMEVGRDYLVPFLFFALILALRAK